MTEPFWVDVDELVDINRDAVEQTGEAHFVRDSGLLESACFRPINLFQYENEDDLVTLAVSLMFGIARNHPFEQGNKRTAFQAAIAFLFANGAKVDLPDDDSIAEAMIAVIVGDETEAWFEDLLADYVS